jgi:hypothetical protein
MKHLRPSVLFSIGIAVLIFATAMSLSVSISAAEKHSKETTAPAAADRALFTAFVPVLRHPRCMNCHTRGDFPRQGDDGHPHAMNVRRGPDGHGVTAEKCSTCHQDHNLVGAHLPPGAPSWGLPRQPLP